LLTLKDDLKGLVRGPHPQTAILDARSVEEYLGKEVAGLPRSGHIPSAVHMAWNVFLNKDATVKDLSVIREMLEANGVGFQQEVICYCTGGVRSAWLYFILKLVGYPKISNYPGSWWEWSRDFACPAEKDLQALQKVLGFGPAPNILDRPRSPV
jgi:thiosulfate/3-mercaptopyruvate sulfurtransferase